ncbi:MAG: GTPase ObgE [Paracoccaceae bacterium]
MKFLDLVKVYIKSGNGGSGALSFRREKYIEKGGPDGGNGGKGGSVWGIPDSNLNTLIDFKYKQHHFAKNGRPGQGKKKTGESAEDIFLKLPLGTEIFDENQKILLGEINNINDKVLLLPGGTGGLGNHNFKSSTNRSPRKFTSGGKGLEKTIYLKLKLIADVGMIGLPNAGKSTLLSKTSNAKPKIANYPFTTLIPKLGIISIYNSQLTIADIPGLIKDAYKGKGAGIRFLGHIEKCKALIHLIDVTSSKIINDYKIVLNELEKYNKELLNRPRITVLNKVDLVDKNTLNKKIKLLAKFEIKLHTISAINMTGLEYLKKDIFKKIVNEKIEKEKENKLEKKWNPID